MNLRGKEQQNERAVCGDMLVNQSCPEPLYALPGAIPGDLAAFVAISEWLARDACAKQLDELRDCVRRHNDEEQRRQKQPNQQRR